MDEKRAAYSLKAPGSSGSSMRLPGRGPFPGVDDHLVKPEVTRDEIIGGRRVVALPALPPPCHAAQQDQLPPRSSRGPRLHRGVGSAHPPRRGVGLRHRRLYLCCIYKEGVDPETGSRYLEEIAFEVVSEQNQKDVTEKAIRMRRRGVRRVFGVFVKGGKVCEWSSESGSWLPLDAEVRIEEPCLVAPLTVAALLDAAVADNAVAEALAIKGNQALQMREAKAEARGEARGQAEAVLKILESRGLAVTMDQRQAILSCRDLDRLDRWLRRAALASSVDEILFES